MKEGSSSSVGTVFLCFALAGLFVGAGIIISFRCVGGVFSEAALFVRNITFEGVSFVPGLKKAILSEMIFFGSVAIFAMSFPASVLPGGIIALESFFMGVSLGLAARCRVMSDAMGIFFAVFVSNFLVLPLEILLFVASLRFSRNVSRLSQGERPAEFVRFFFRILIFFILMCIAQCVQIGIGILVLGS